MNNESMQPCALSSNNSDNSTNVSSTEATSNLQRPHCDLEGKSEDSPITSNLVNGTTVPQFLRMMRECDENYDEDDRIHRLLAAGLSKKLISELVGRSQSHVSRLTDFAVYTQHLRFNSEYRRRRRREAKKGNNNSTETNMSDEQIEKLVTDLKSAFLPVLNRIADALQKIAQH